MPGWPQKLAYCIANVMAVVAALYIAFRLDLDRPYWAMFTVFIVSKPLSGAVRAKGVYRFAGTLVGASTSVFLVPPLVQSPLLLSLAVSAWVGLCLFAALQDRTPRSYAFLLAGYSVAIVGLSTVNAPTTIFDVALSRFEEISIGIICAAVAHSVFFPQNFGDVLRSKATAAIAKSAAIAAGAIGTPSEAPSVSQVASIASTVTELHTLYSQIGFETSNVRRVPTVMAGLLDRISLILPKASLIFRALAARKKYGAISEALRELLDDAAAALTALGSKNTADSDTVLANLDAFSEVLDESEVTESAELEQLVVRHVIELITSLQEAELMATALTDESAARGMSALLPTNTRRPLYRDQGLAFLSAASAAGGTLVACALWIWNSWPEGFVAAQFAAICCSLFATLDNPSKVIGEAVIGIIVALPVAAVYEFAILPGVDGFVSLALVLSPMLLLFSFLQTNERLEGAAMILAVAFSGALALQESFASDFAVFVNSNLAEICGPLIAIAMLLVFRTVDPLWNADRMLRSGRKAVKELTCAVSGDSKAWMLQMFDRIGMVAARLGPAATDTAQRDLLRDLRIGLNIITLQNLRNELTNAVSLAVQEVMLCLCEVYAAKRTDSFSQPMAVLRDRIIALATAFSYMPASEERLEGLVAVNGLCLDFEVPLFSGAQP
jgi:uncharacterized membrane protein YccC